MFARPIRSVPLLHALSRAYPCTNSVPVCPSRLETHPGLTHADGCLALARRPDPNSANSQFYICDGAQPSLDGQYAVFGKVIDGMDVVRAISAVETGARDVPVEDVVIVRAAVEE